jgi:hypothetical protein
MYSTKYLADFPHSTKLFIRGNKLITGNAQTLQTRRLWGLNFVQQCLTFVDPQYGTCFMSPLWHLEFWGSSKIFGKLVHSCLMIAFRRTQHLTRSSQFPHQTDSTPYSNETLFLITAYTSQNNDHAHLFIHSTSLTECFVV